MQVDSLSGKLSFEIVDCQRAAAIAVSGQYSGVGAGGFNNNQADLEKTASAEEFSKQISAAALIGAKGFGAGWVIFGEAVLSGGSEEVGGEHEVKDSGEETSGNRRA
ncbi:hypothetical protein U1Q18_000765 [Sarracenia purpurea var. burkii]